MTDDKLEKVRAEIERRKKEVKDQIVEFGTFESGRLGLYDDVEKYDDLLSFIDSMQEECNITGIKSKHATGKLKECIDNITDESLAKTRKQLEENPQECIYARDNYTDEDRQALCDGCEEECRFNKKEDSASDELEKVVEEIVDPTVLNAYGVKEIANRLRRTMIESVIEDLNTVAKEYANNITDKIGYRLQLRRAVCFGANWQKEQLIAKAVDATVHIDAGGYPYIQQMELYDYEKDIPLAKEGDKYKVILIKEG